MIDNETLLPDSIAIVNDVQAFDLAGKKQLQTIDVSKLLVYNIDQVDEAALPLLAEQFDVLGYKGMRLAPTTADQRALIKKAIELHRYNGTIYGVREAIKSVGFANATIFEHVNGHWANFSIDLLNEGVGITAETVANLRKMIEEYKNTRSNLVLLNINLLVNDEMGVDDDADMVEDWLNDDTLIFSNALLYDGAGDYDGSYDHSGDSDVVEWV